MSPKEPPPTLLVILYFCVRGMVQQAKQVRAWISAHKCRQRDRGVGFHRGLSPGNPQPFRPVARPSLFHPMYACPTMHQMDVTAESFGNKRGRMWPLGTIGPLLAAGHWRSDSDFPVSFGRLRQLPPGPNGSTDTLITASCWQKVCIVVEKLSKGHHGRTTPGHRNAVALLRRKPRTEMDDCMASKCAANNDYDTKALLRVALASSRAWTRPKKLSLMASRP